jgi:hypothetical protein
MAQAARRRATGRSARPWRRSGRSGPDQLVGRVGLGVALRFPAQALPAELGAPA